MANKSAPQFPQLILGGRGGLGRVRVDMEAFFDFSFWLAEELEDLVQTKSRSLPRTASQRRWVSRLSDLERHTG